MRPSKLIWYFEEFLIYICEWVWAWVLAFLNAIAADPNFILENHKKDPYRPWVIKVAEFKKKIFSL